MTERREPDRDGRTEAAGQAADRARAELHRARTDLERASAGIAELAPVARALRRIEARLARSLRLAVAGEFNAGKSSLANLLAGIESLPTAVVSNTSLATLLYFAAAPEIFAREFGGGRRRLAADSSIGRDALLRLEVGLPSARLRSLEILDLPGLGDPQSDVSLGDLSLHGVDAVAWCTVCTQAWRESEREAWTQLPARLQRRALLVATHQDLLQGPGDERRMLARLGAEAGATFHEIVPIATRRALTAAEAARSSRPADVAGGAQLARLNLAVDRLASLVSRQRTAAALAVTRRIAAGALGAIG